MTTETRTELTFETATIGLRVDGYGREGGGWLGTIEVRDEDLNLVFVRRDIDGRSGWCVPSHLVMADRTPIR